MKANKVLKGLYRIVALTYMNQLGSTDIRQQFWHESNKIIKLGSKRAQLAGLDAIVSRATGGTVTTMTQERVQYRNKHWQVLFKRTL